MTPTPATTPLPCPFCDGEAVIEGEDSTWAKLCRVRCGTCYANRMGYTKTKADAIDAWNHRSALPVPPVASVHCGGCHNLHCGGVAAPVARSGEVERTGRLLAEVDTALDAGIVAITTAIDGDDGLDGGEGDEYLAILQQAKRNVAALSAVPTGETRAENWRHDLLIQAAWPTFDKEIGGTAYGLISKRDLEMICDRAALPPSHAGETP